MYTRKEYNMFLDNEYTNEYYSIIKKNKNLTKGLSNRSIKKSFPYTERHHIIPDSLGGSNLSDNLVFMSAIDHYKCHQLLTKMTEGEALMKMWSALWRMMNKQSRNQKRDYVFSAEEYEAARLIHSKSQSLRMTGDKNPFFNQKHSAESIEKMSAVRKGKTYEEIYGVERGQELREKRRNEVLGIIRGKQEILLCPHCGKAGGVSMMKRWHMDRCKFTKTSYLVDE